MSIAINGIVDFFKNKRWIFDIIVISICVYFLALTFVLIISSKIPSFEARKDSIKQKIIKKNTQKPQKALFFSYFSPIIQRDLFNSKVIRTVQKKPKAVIVENIPVSQRLGLKLVGTIVGDPTNLSRAIVYSSKNGKYVLWKINEKLNGATLERVLRDQVIVDVNGKKERLVTKAEPHSKEFQKRLSITNTHGESIVKSKSGDSVYTLSRDEINKAFNDLPSLLSGATAVPYRRNGISGFILRDVRPNSIYSKVGLKRGDVIVSVNGHALRNTSQLMQLYNDIRNQSEVKMNIVRHNQKKVLTYYLE